MPIQVINVPLGTGTHESGCDHWAPVESTPRIERLSIHEPTRTATTIAAIRFLHHGPFREPPRTDALCRLTWLTRIRRRGIEAWSVHTGHELELGSEPRLNDLFEVTSPRPGVEPPNNGGVLREINQRAGTVGGDHLAAT
jgi:hypothetical protein